MKPMKLLATSLLALSLGPVGVVLATHPDALEVQTQNGIDYLAGGIGKEQAEAMKVAAHDYDLMLTFATDGGKYLADIHLQIEDMNGNTLLSTVSKGPLFLANLPVGRYEITASAQGTSHTTIVDIGREHPAKAVFQWPGYAPTPMLPISPASSQRSTLEWRFRQQAAQAVMNCNGWPG